MKSKTKRVKRGRKEVSKKVLRKMKISTRRTKPKSGLSREKKEIAARVWPRITNSTRFVELPEGQGSVSYELPSGQAITATLKWFIFTHGPRVFGHYDDANNVCYIGEIIE